MPWRGTEGPGAGDDTIFDLARAPARRPGSTMGGAGRPRGVELTAEPRTGKLSGFPTGGIPAAAVAMLTANRRHAPALSAGGRSGARTTPAAGAEPRSCSPLRNPS